MVYRGHVINHKNDRWLVLRSDEQLHDAASEQEAMDWIDKKREKDYARSSKR
jgi:hypothetical protein